MSVVRFIAGSLVFVALLSAQEPAAPPARDPKADPASQVAPELKRFMDVFSVVQSMGAGGQTADKMIFEGAIPSMLRRLDPHTQFFEPAQFDQLKQMEAAEQKGFGSIVSVLPGHVIFLQTLPGTPTSKAGIQPGDELVAINNVALQGLEADQIIELLTEARQQRITIFVRRQGNSRILQFTLTPELQDSPTVDRTYKLRPNVGLIRITSWDTQTARQFQQALDTLDASHLQGLIIDLRDNPGGVVSAALQGASMFLQPGQRILTAKGRTGVVQSADVPKTAKPLSVNLAILVNGKTASASEIFTGAMQDHDRAVVVGETSYGKGLVQSVMPLSDGAGLALTTAFYYTPSGRSIQHPLRDSALSNTFGDAPPDKNAPTYKTDSGRTVTGGGGIRPDVVAAPAERSRLESVLDASGSFTSFATDYLSHHSPLPDNFEVTPAIIDEFKVYLSERRIQPNVGEWSSEGPWIRNRMREEIVTQAHGVAAGDQIAAERDPQIQAALKALENSGALAASR